MTLSSVIGKKSKVIYGVESNLNASIMSESEIDQRKQYFEEPLTEIYGSRL